MTTLQQQFGSQQFFNDYQLVNGIAMHTEIVFHEDHILAVHDIHRQELVAGMDAVELKELTQWLAVHYRPQE